MTTCFMAFCLVLHYGEKKVPKDDKTNFIIQDPSVVEHFSNFVLPYSSTGSNLILLNCHFPINKMYNFTSLLPLSVQFNFSNYDHKDNLSDFILV